jgi:hypothetical protein
VPERQRRAGGAACRLPSGQHRGRRSSIRSGGWLARPGAARPAACLQASSRSSGGGGPCWSPSQYLLMLLPLLPLLLRSDAKGAPWRPRQAHSGGPGLAGRRPWPPPRPHPRLPPARPPARRSAAQPMATSHTWCRLRRACARWPRRRCPWWSAPSRSASPTCITC